MSIWRWARAFFLWGALLGSGLAFAVELVRETGFSWNGSRLAAVMGLKFGYRLYYGVGEGPILNTIYGPLSYYPYLPTLALDNPTDAIFAGQIISALLYVIPWIFLSAASAEGLPRKFMGLLVAGLPAVLMVTLKTQGLRYSAVNIHSDAPALFFVGMSLILVGEARAKAGTGTLVTAAALAASGLWAKQTTVMAPLAVTAYLWLNRRYREGLMFLAGVGFFGALLGACFAGVHGYRELELNLFRIPGGHPWRESYFSGARYLLGLPLVWALAGCAAFRLVSTGLQVRDGKGRWSHELESPWILYGMAAVAAFPVSVLGYVKDGGWDNSASPFLYSGMLMAHAIARQSLADEPERPWSARTVRTVIAAFTLICFATGYFLGWREVRDRWRIRMFNPNQLAFDQIRSDPRIIYYPTLPLAALMAQGKLYHFSRAVQERELAGIEIGASEIERWTPEKPELISLILKTPRPRERVYMMKFFPNHTEQLNDVPFKGWTSYREAGAAAEGPAR